MMEFIYPRRITISRPNTDGSTGGTIPYQGVLPIAETVLFTNIPASIQKKSGLQKPNAKLPSDVAQNYCFNVFVWVTFLARGSIKNNDIVTDDDGHRYQVYANYWDSLGYNMTVERLQN